MKFSTRTEEDGKVVLKLGTTHEVGFSSDIDLEGIATGVTMLVERVTGVSSVDLVMAVVNEFNRGQEATKE